MENVSKMPPEAQQHPQVQADLEQARKVVAEDAASKAQPSTLPLSVEDSRKLIENVSKMSPEAQQHPQVQADLEQARKVVAEDAAGGPASQGQGAAADAPPPSAPVQSANATSTATNEPTSPNNSNTGSYPSIDHDHIIKADFNKNGDPTGGHSLVNNDVRIIPGTAGQPNPQGVYEARVEMQNSSGGWQAKLSNGGWNTMFPKNWSEHQIKTEVEAAWNSSMKTISPNGKKWRSITPSGVVVEGYINPHTPNKTGRITAYPIY